MRDWPPAFLGQQKKNCRLLLRSHLEKVRHVALRNDQRVPAPE
jgi:hypothetical protein